MSTTRKISSTLVDEQILLIDQRDREIKELSDNALEVRALMSDFSNLVVGQQEHIDNIESNIVKAHDNTKAGVDELKKAEKYQPRCTIV